MNAKQHERALVLGAGGHAGIAWEIGIAAGLRDGGVDLRTADLFVGTSAGAFAAVRIASDLDLDAALALQIDPSKQPDESAPPVDFNQWRADYGRLKSSGGTPIDILQRIGTMAVSAQTVPAEERLAIVKSRLPVDDWPSRRVMVVAVDTQNGQRRVFERDSGVSMADAIAASSAVPGIWPAVEIGGRRYMDGGVYSIDNADLARDCDRVVIVTLRPRVPPICLVSLDTAVTSLLRSGSRVEIVYPDEAAEAAFASVGGNLLDPAVRARAAVAGRDQGRRIAAKLAAAWW